MPSKAGIWENADFLMELSLALFQVASNGGALGTQAKIAVENYLKAQGHDQSWESVRFLLLPQAPSRSYRSLRFALTTHNFPLFAPCLTFSQTAKPIDMARSQMKWDAAAHEAMLICIFKNCNLNAGEMGKVLEEMKMKGYEFTENAFRQHIQKLRKARDTSALDGSGDSSKPATPRKATPRKTPTSGRKRKAEVDSDADELGLNVKDEAAPSLQATPSKRVKAEPSSDVADWKNTAFQNIEF